MGGGAFPDDITLRVRRVGQEYCDPKKKREHRLWDTYDSLHVVLYGSGTLIAGGEEKTLSKGDVFLLYSKYEYEYYPSPTDPWSDVWVDFYSSDTRKLCEGCGLSPERPYIHLADLQNEMVLLRALYESYERDETRLECTANFLLLLSAIMRENGREPAAKERTSVGHRHIRSLVTYINNNFRLPLTVQNIAAQNHISVSRMMGLFSEEIGIPPISYLNRYRVSAACELLCKTDMPVGEIANAVGVEDRLYFSRLFKKWKGVSPREYRANATETDPFAWLKEKNIDFR